MTHINPHIRNCQFGYRCPKTWDALGITEDSAIRYCDKCEQNVHFCHTDAQLVDAIHHNRCIAINRLGGGQDDPETTFEVGNIESVYQVE